MKKIRWGLLASSGIAKSFVNGVNCLDDAEIIAVASRTLEKAQDFARAYAIPKAYGSYEELTRDPDVDAIYISTPHVFHKECALMCLRAGKPVLCEKPFAINANEVKEAIAVATEYKVFLMEAMWTRFLPIYEKVSEWLEQGVIGEVRHVKASFGFAGQFDPKGRLYNRELGGGALLDVGVYTVSFLSYILGLDVKEMYSVADLGQSGVDEVFSAILLYQDGKTAAIDGAIRADISNDAWICGTKGKIHLPDFWRCEKAILYIGGKDPVTITEPYEAGFSFEIAEVMKCLREGRLESPLMPLNETLKISQIMDSLRMGWGIVYPNDIL